MKLAHEVDASEENDQSLGPQAGEKNHARTSDSNRSVTMTPTQNKHKMKFP